MWEGELGNVSSHVNDVCGYQLVQCPNKFGEEMERRDIEKHKKDNCKLREYTNAHIAHPGAIVIHTRM